VAGAKSRCLRRRRRGGSSGRVTEQAALAGELDPDEPLLELDTRGGRRAQPELVGPRGRFDTSNTPSWSMMYAVPTSAFRPSSVLSAHHHWKVLRAGR
jgi:hypothetical protein